MRNWLVGLLVIGIISVLGCQSKDKQGTQGEVKVGVAGPFSGNAAAFGEMIKRGAELKAKQINEAGGINGMKLTLDFGDDTGTEKEAKLVRNALCK